MALCTAAADDCFLTRPPLHVVCPRCASTISYKVVEVARLAQHSDMVTGIIVINGQGPGLGLMCSSGMDGDVRCPHPSPVPGRPVPVHTRL